MLRKNILIPVLLFIIVPAIRTNADNVKTTKANVSAATVFLSGAQLTCSAEFTAQPGINQFVFENVSPLLDPNSLQASGKGNIVIMDAKFLTRYNESPKKPAPKPLDNRLKLATDSLTLLGYEIDELNEQLLSLQTEKNIILNNRLIKGETHRDTLELFTKSIEFLRQRLNNISTETTSYKKQLFYKNEQQRKLQERINLLSQIDNNIPVQEDLAVHTIIVMVHADVAAQSTISVSFYVPNAAWLPAYDLRANGNGTIDLIHKAELSQNTGMDWNNISLTLSTGNPNQNQQKPVLTPFYLGFVQQYKHKLSAGYADAPQTLQSVTINEGKTKKPNREEPEMDAVTIAELTTASEGMIETQYDIKLKYTIPNGDNMHVIAIQNKNIKAAYKYASVPKIDNGAYLIADITDWNEMNLIPGTSRIYFDGSYLGKSFLDPSQAEDTLTLSLGKDRAININRKKLKDKTKEKIFADNKTVSTTYEIMIRNNKSTAATININDQIPLSNMDDVKVELISSDSAVYNAETGLLNWDVTLKPKEVKKIRFTYEVKLPKDKRLAGI